MTLGERIIELRNMRGISQNDLAESMGVSRQSVSKWETGTSTPDLEKLVKLANYFGLSLDELVKGKEPSKETTTETSGDENKRTKSQNVGVLFLCLSAFSALLFAVAFGALSIIFAVPFLIIGVICYFSKCHPILKAAWAGYLMFSLYLHCFTAISPNRILQTFQWTYQMNYAILVFSWIWFLIVVLLIITTAFILKNEAYSRKCDVLGITLFVLSYVPSVFGYAAFWSVMVCTYLQLAGITILAIDFARRLASRKKQIKAAVASEVEKH